MQFIHDLLEHPSLLAYFSGANNYTWLQFRNGERRLLAKPLTYFEERLPGFVRIHKTALINPVFVDEVQSPPGPKMAGAVRMKDGTQLPVSRRRWRDVQQTLCRPGPVLPEAPTVTPEPTGRPAPYQPPQPRLLALMTGDALLLTRECIETADIACTLQALEHGAGLANTLLLRPAATWPSLILMDARFSRPDRVLTLRTLKTHPQLRAIPVVWLAGSEQDTMQAYQLDANSVVVVPDDPASFTRLVRQLCTYWLTVVQLPPEEG
ncbi:LytTR family transcriptional regulator [Rudanella paleaurantiibacter]|uniref:LytTR family transcriptional regulator n=1 Tax=Rudanella paleaurantiibacter TaxID=2614655 RepID=A0A7J5TXL3_9BACT|nr:LytTR family transcriptional regulator DNA-binding domain-containing protein [Rudanella paleaurantiibacter]KAB7729385.1 LytTR family transcriptional regulator [Rudanella paleaurantiibacter]